MNTNHLLNILIYTLLSWTIDAQRNTEPRLWQYGCWRKNKIINNSPSTTIQFNSPGMCYDYCDQLNNYTTLYLALQTDFCACLNNLDTSVSALGNIGNGCVQKCPGNMHHFCGNSPVMVSVYKIQMNAMTNTHLCTQMDCSGNIPLNDKNCSETAQYYCGLVPTQSDTHCVQTIGLTEGNWTGMMSSCSTNNEARYNITCPLLLPCITVPKWAGAFGKYAPSGCGYLRDIMNGTVTLTGAQVGDTAVYTCASGYLLSQNTSKRTCLSDGTWTGTEPRCNAKPGNVTTTSITSTTMDESPGPVSPPSSDGSNGAVIAGIVIAILLLLVTVIFVFVTWKKRILCFKQNHVTDSNIEANETNASQTPTNTRFRHSGETATTSEPKVLPPSDGGPAHSSDVPNTNVMTLRKLLVHKRVTSKNVALVFKSKRRVIKCN